MNIRDILITITSEADYAGRIVSRRVVATDAEGWVVALSLR